MKTQGSYSEDNSDAESIANDRAYFSGHLGPPAIRKKGSKKTARFNLPSESSGSGGSRASGSNNDDGFVEITLDITDDSVVMVSSVEPAAGDHEDPDPAKKAHKSGSSLLRSTSSYLKRFGASPSPTPPAQPLDPAKSSAGLALKRLNFIAKKTGKETSWPEVEAKFDELAGETKLLQSSDFGKCLCMEEKSYKFGTELFKALARRFKLGDSINKDQLRVFWDRITDDNFHSRLQTFFDMIDNNADGRVTKEEVAAIIRLCASANQLIDIEEQADEYSVLIMRDLDPGNAGYIMVGHLERLLLEGPEQVVRGNSQFMSQEVSKMLKKKEERNSWKGWYNRLKYFITDHWQRVWVITLWLAACSTLFIYKFVEYRYKDDPFTVMGYCVCFAKGAAETLKLNMALVLLPVCRNTITWLRNKTSLGVIVPFNDNINFHQVIAVGVMVGVVLHAGAHLTCDFPRVLLASDQKYNEHLAKYLGEERPASYWWFVKGWEGVTGIVMILLMVVAFTLATPSLRTNKFKDKLDKLPKQLKRVSSGLKIVTGFNAFWYSHHLFVIVYALLIIHGIKLYFTTDKWQKTTWMYIVVPIALYTSERLIRVFRSTVEEVKILTVAHYPGNLLALTMFKPSGFEYKSGQYMFVNCPAVSPFEWHPFSITSAPGDDHLGVHIRAVGDWTKQIKKVFSDASRENLSYPKISIDGAYGAPAQDYKKYDIVLLIGLGVGATPMISIVKDIINNMRTIQEEDQALTSSTVEFKRPRAYFYWVTPTQGTFEWFKGIMNEVEEIDERKAIEMHNYCSSVYEENDARSGLIAMLQTLYYAKNGEDLLSKTRVKSHFAKPDWRKVYKRVAVHHPDKTVGVFYCGRADPVKDLKHWASEFSRKTNTKFEFHKENF